MINRRSRYQDFFSWFWQNVDKTETCWLWKRALTEHGYGRVAVVVEGKRKLERVHRISYEIAHGELPETQCVLHTCDVRHCVNPSHLFLGTKTENNEDRDDKGRQAFGERNHSKLTEEQVLEIRKLHGTMSLRAIGTKFNISHTVVHKIALGLKWSHLHGIT